ncbi:MAG: type II secretion system major pseudopilin GspG [Vulcanimicrobiota bacterium]
MKHRKMRGFTFLEIMVVVAILAILAGLIIPRFVGRAEEARKTKGILQMKEIMKSLELYKLDNGKYPTTEQGLLALVEQPTSEPVPKKWKQYMDKVPLDPWKNNFIYICPGADHGRKTDTDREKTEGKYGYFDLICTGPDGVQDSEDDMKSWDMPED